MRAARSTIGLAVLILFLGFGLSAGEADEVRDRTILGEDGGELTRIRPASRTVSDRQRERRQVSRDRARRRFARDAAELLPHFADYTVHESGFATSRFKRAHGTLTVEMIAACNDWTLQEKWNLDLFDQAGEAHHSDLLYRGSELTATDRFEFAYSRNHLGEQTDFIGDVLAIEGGFMARFREPEIPDLFLPQDLVFPITHLRQVLAEARRQRTGFEAITFDGGNAIPYRAVATISQPLLADDTNPRVVAARAELDPKTSDRLPDGRYWPVRIDYFPLDDAYAPPIFTREFLLHENGIILSFHFDYGDIQLDARLKYLDIRRALPCKN